MNLLSPLIPSPRFDLRGLLGLVGSEFMVGTFTDDKYPDCLGMIPSGGILLLFPTGFVICINVCLNIILNFNK